MGETRPPAEAPSPTSEDSIRAPPRLDTTRLKPGPGALPPDAFDPLKHDDWEQFWYSIDRYFQPINQQDVAFLRSVPVSPYGGANDPHLRVEPTRPIAEKRPASASKSVAPARSPERDVPDDTDITTASLNSFPYTHRLVAAMLDVGGVSGAAVPPPLSARGNRGANGMDVAFWMGVGADSDVRAYQNALEERVKLELVENGLLEPKPDEEVQTALRASQWQLRDAKTITRMRKSALYTLIIGSELRSQAIRREVKKHHDMVEIAYLERMVRNMKKNKKSRAKYQKLLHKMFGHYKEKEKGGHSAKKAVETITNGRLLTNGEDKARPPGKKKKKKSDAGLHANTAGNSSGARFT